jgi:hypothetical protein
VAARRGVHAAGMALLALGCDSDVGAAGEAAKREREA